MVYRPRRLARRGSQRWQYDRVMSQNFSEAPHCSPCGVERRVQVWKLRCGSTNADAVDEAAFASVPTCRHAVNSRREAWP